VFCEKEGGSVDTSCRGRSQINNYTSESDGPLAGLNLQLHKATFSFPDALQLCQRGVELLKTDARNCVKGSQQAALCVQPEDSSVDLTKKLGNTRRRTRSLPLSPNNANMSSRGDPDKMYAHPEGSNVGFRVGMF
jgi:hypothetical protein